MRQNLLLFLLPFLFLPVIARADNVDCNSPNIDLSHEPKCKPGELTIIQELVPSSQLRCMGMQRKLVSCPGSDTKLIPKQKFYSFIGTYFDDPKMIEALKVTNSMKQNESVNELMGKLNEMKTSGVGVSDNGSLAEFKKLQYLRDKYSAWLKLNQNATDFAKPESLASMIIKNQTTMNQLRSRSCSSSEYDSILKSNTAIIIRFDDGFEQMLFPYDYSMKAGQKYEIKYIPGVIGLGGFFAEGNDPNIIASSATIWTDAKGQTFYKSSNGKTYQISGVRSISLKDASKSSNGSFVNPCKIQSLIKGNVPTSTPAPAPAINAVQ